MFDESYAREPFTRRPKKRLPEVVAVAGSNFLEVGFAVGPAEGGKRTVTCFSAIDNLIKGGAGQAIQNMNLVLGCDERASLEDVGNWP
jgi:N-acetyl-gamma-glutamyl-phosphate reductase